MIKSMKIIFMLVFVVIFSTNVNAQAGYEDVVYLKNGSVIHGIIIEQIPNQSLKIQTADKNVFVFKMDEVEKLTKEKKTGNEKEKQHAAPSEFKESNYTGYSLYIESQLGPGIGDNSTNKVALAAHAINGAELNGMFYFGLGVGFDLLNASYSYVESNGYTYTSSTTNMLMVYYLDIRTFPVKGKISPIIIFDYGYSSSMSGSDVSGGMMFNSGVGVRLNFTERMAFNMSLNYKYQKMTYTRNTYDYQTNTNTSTDYHLDPQYLCLTVGLNF